MSSNLINFYTGDELNNKIKKLRTLISNKLLEKDNLEFHICKNIENSYIIKFGSIEYKVYKAENKWRKSKRKLELITIARNKKLNLSVEDIDKKLDEEFKEYKIKLEKKIQKLNDAIELSKQEYLSEEKTEKIKKMYRKIVKSLHPDLNPEISESQRELFIKASEAYKEGDIELVEIIYNVLDDNVDSFQIEKYPVKEVKRLNDILEKLIGDIENIKNSYPYILSEVLNSEEKMKEKIEELEEQYELYSNATIKYEEEIKIYEKFLK